MSLKECSKCHIFQSIDNFFKSGLYPSGKPKIRGDCKTCAKKNTAEWREKKRAHYNSYMGEYRAKNPDKIRLHEIKRHYGLSADEYRALIAKTNNSCELCGKKASGKRPLSIDHCHNSKKVRGLLCYGCNRLMGLLDNPSLYAKALEYKKRHS